MDEKLRKELSTRRTVILHDSLTELRKDILPIQAKDEKIKEVYMELENAFSKIFDEEAKFRVEQ